MALTLKLKYKLSNYWLNEVNKNFDSQSKQMTFSVIGRIILVGTMIQYSV
jgi:hypothetical protein